MPADNSQNRRASKSLGFLVAALSVALTTFIRWRLDPLLGGRFAFLILFAGVALTVWYGGWLPAVFAAVAGFLVSDWLFIEPRYQFGLSDPMVLAGLAGYTVSCAFIIYLGEALRRARQRAEERGERLSRELVERKHRQDQLRRLYVLSQVVNRAEDLPAIYQVALDGLIGSLNADRGSILLWDPDGVLRFKAWRGLSDDYRRATEGHSPWKQDERDPRPISMGNVAEADLGESLRKVVQSEGIGALAFIPLVAQKKLLGKVMVYYNGPHIFNDDELRHAEAIADQVAFASDRKASEVARRESEARLRSALDAGKLGVWEWDIPTDRLTWSERLFEFHGLDSASFTGKGDSFFKLVHPDDKEHLQTALTKALEERAPYELEFRTVLPDGAIRWFKTTARVVFDPDGKPLRMLGGTFDLTDRKQLEEMLKWQAARLDQLVLERTAKLNETVAELEAFSYTIAHDMRAPLRSMQSFAHFLDNEYTATLGDSGKEYTRRIISAAMRMDKLITDVLTYSRVSRTELELTEVDTHKLVLGILESYPIFQKPNAVLWIRGRLPPVIGNEALLTQCFSNLLGNAVKFVPAVIIPKVEIGADVGTPSPVNQTEDQEQPSAAEPAKATAQPADAGSGDPAYKRTDSGDVTRVPPHGGSKRVRISIQDNGIGIASEAQELIFGAFQRLSNRYEGTGIGLAIVRKAVERMGGKTGVQSVPGKGSRFWFELDSK